jgi:transposase
VIHPVQEDLPMPMPLSLDIRRRFHLYIEDGLSGREAARRLMILPATASRLGQKIARSESLSPMPCGPKRGNGKLAPYHDFLIELVTQDPDITLYELRDALLAAHGAEVHHSAIGYALDRLGYTFKKRALLPVSAGGPVSGTPAMTG